VQETLESFGGFEIERPTPTSVVARLRTGRPGATLALRAELDALPIQEESGLPFASRYDGVMHACGHDAHTAMLLATARLLLARREELSGELRVRFQHAEELPPGGAVELVAVGVMDGVDGVIGCHVLLTMDAGTVAAIDGPCTAAADTFSITIHGRGGHAGFPHLAVDPIVVAAQTISSLQHLVARTTSPLDSVVVSVTRIASGTADNVIPEAVELGGTVRCHRETSRQRTHDRIERVLEGVTAAHGARYDLEYRDGYAPVVNDARLAAMVRDAAGQATVADFDPLMAGDDFSAYSSGHDAVRTVRARRDPGADPGPDPRV
jgi:amidohydrolase